MSLSWLHHKGRNRHHFEYWIDYGIGCSTGITGMPMPKKYIAEMIMDRISASGSIWKTVYTEERLWSIIRTERSSFGSFTKT